MHYDLIIRRARLHRVQETVDIAVKDGLFARIAPGLSDAQAAREIDAMGCLVIPAFCRCARAPGCRTYCGAAAL